MTPKLSCGRCWTRAFTTVGISAIFVSTAILHVIDPSHIEGLGLPRNAAYVISTIELFAVIGLWVIRNSEWVENTLLAITVGAAGLYVKTGQVELLPLPAIPMAMLLALKWVNRPQMACACALRHAPLPTASGAEQTL